jgi:hypothetical protein
VLSRDIVIPAPELECAVTCAKILWTVTRSVRNLGRNDPGGIWIDENPDEALIDRPLMGSNRNSSSYLIDPRQERFTDFISPPGEFEACKTPLFAGLLDSKIDMAAFVEENLQSSLYKIW